KVNTKPVDYAVLNQLSQDFETGFVPQNELSAEQVFWSQNLVNSKEPNPSTRPTQVEVLKELPKVSMVNTSLKKLKHNLASFDVTVHMLTKPQVFYNHATRQALGFQNPCYLKKAQQLKLDLYDGSVIGKSNVIVVPDSEETLMLAEESRSKMIKKQNDPQMIEKKVITKPIDYAILNQLSTDFNTWFVPQTESSTEQAFWS
nr:hypothetical protein [Tanacetum cinerariifolium]